MEIDSQAPNRKRGGSLRKRWILILLGGLALILGARWLTRPKPAFHPILNVFKARSQIRTIQSQAAAYQKLHGDWPETLSNIQLVKLLAAPQPPSSGKFRIDFEGAAIDPWNQAYTIRITASKELRLVSSGPDRIPNTGDDIEEP